MSAGIVGASVKDGHWLVSAAHLQLHKVRSAVRTVWTFFCKNVVKEHVIEIVKKLQPLFR